MKLLFIILCTLSTNIYANKGKAIMEAVDKRDTGKNFIASYNMTLINKNKQKERTLLWWRIETAKSTKNLIKIMEPKSLKNTGLLIYSNKTSENDTWLFLSKAAKKEPRKIASNAKDSRFLGSEFYYVDFEENEVKDFTHKYLKTGQVNSWKVDIVESVPKDKSYIYQKLVSYVDQVSKVAVKIDMYRNGKLEKIFTVKTLEKIDKIWTVKQSLMDNKVKKKQTELKLNKIQYNANITENHFSLTTLTREL